MLFSPGSTYSLDYPYYVLQSNNIINDVSILKVIILNKELFVKKN
jgi:hypothetical protein